MALTDTAIRHAKPIDKDYSLADGLGLSLFIAKSGSKSWHFRFSWRERQVRISFGTYPELSLREARVLRDECRSLVVKGIDPREHRRKAQLVQTGTFEVIANQWYAFKSPRLTTGRKGSAAQCRAYLDKDLIPVLGPIPLAEITRANVLSAVRRVEKRGALNVAEKCRTWLNQIFRYAMAEGLVDFNPASDLDIVAAAQPPTKHNPILRQDELGAFLLDLRSASGSILTQAGIRLLLLTGVRTQELRFASPDQFDLENALWRVPPDAVKQLRGRLRTQSGAIPPYLVPLSRQAVAVVRELLPITGNYRYLLAGRNNPSKPMSENTLNGAIKRMGYEGRLTGHGIRGTLSTALNELGYRSDWIEAQLSHADPNQVRGAYNHAQYVEQRRQMMQEWADLLDRLEQAGKGIAG